jgi:hypothetical protein
MKRLSVLIATGCIFAILNVGCGETTTGKAGGKAAPSAGSPPPSQPVPAAPGGAPGGAPAAPKQRTRGGAD